MGGVAKPKRPAALGNFSAGASAGYDAVRRAFLNLPRFTAAPGQAPSAEVKGLDAPIILIERGVAYTACSLPGGRRVVLDLLLAGDLAGFEHALLGGSNSQLIAADALDYRAMTVGHFQALARARDVWMSLTALLLERNSRMDRHAGMRRLEAGDRIAVFLLDLYDRLRRRRLISRPSFRLPLTQAEIADHLGMTVEHFNRTLAEMRDEGLIQVRRQIVVNIRVSRLRSALAGLPQVCEIVKPAPLVKAQARH